MFDDYEEIDPKFEVTVADNGYVLSFTAKERGKDDSWSSEHTFVFGNLDQLSSAIDAITEVV